MDAKETGFRFLNRTTLKVIGVLLIFCAAVMLLWHGNATSNQAMPALVAQVYFDGEYRIADGPWQKIVAGEHIPATKGDVTLRGNFHILAPDGEYILQTPHLLVSPKGTGNHRLTPATCHKPSSSSHFKIAILFILLSLI